MLERDTQPRGMAQLSLQRGEFPQVSLARGSSVVSVTVEGATFNEARTPVWACASASEPPSNG
jgi:hypothetical protein